MTADDWRRIAANANERALRSERELVYVWHCYQEAGRMWHNAASAYEIERLRHFITGLVAVGHIADLAASVRFYQDQVEIALGAL